MEIKWLTEENVDDYIAYLTQALSLEPDLMCTDVVDEISIKQAVGNRNNGLCHSLLAYEDNKVIGRLEFHFYVCLQDLFKMAYVDWLYVLPSYRHQGVAQQLFKEFEKFCVKQRVNQYFLIQADNGNAQRFYRSFENAVSSFHAVLRKTI